MSIAKEEEEFREELTCRAAWSERQRRTCGEQTEQRCRERRRGVSKQHLRTNSLTGRGGGSRKKKGDVKNRVEETGVGKRAMAEDEDEDDIKDR